ncbi:MAG: hypothetical protein WA919_02105 [Coleofasciculaceae cyanobacterium]
MKKATILSLILSALLVSSTSEQTIASNQSIPTTPWQDTQLPDWNQITFTTMPGIGSDGSFQAPADITQQLGYDPSRTWFAGQTPDQYLKLGDFQTSFRLQDFSLLEIAAVTGLDLANFSLAEFGPMFEQTLGSLVEAVPDLQSLTIEQVPPVLDLLQANLTSSFDSTQTIGEFLSTSPHLSNLEFSSLPLDGYGLDTVPGLDTTPLGFLKNWQNSTIEQIPGLSEVPFSQFPGGINAVGSEVGIVDIAFGSAEQQRQRTISGSDVEGFSVPCTTECTHVELSGNEKVKGRQWISGKYQEVRGGKGILASVNGGMEPTGRHPFGEAFKVVVWDVSETEGTVETALFFRICTRNSFIDLGCTPYYLGPIPWLSYREGVLDTMFLGVVDSSPSSSSPSTPTGVSSPVAQSTFSQQKTTSSCSNSSHGLALDALSKSLSDSAGNYNKVGDWICNDAGNCGRGLGNQQFMSYRNDVRLLISSKPGGKEFLAKVDSGEIISGEEMLLYFHKGNQDSLFQQDLQVLLNQAAQQIDPTTGQLFRGKRLVERVAQMQFGGLAIPIDSEARDVHQQLTVKGYGEKAASFYQSNCSG